MTEMVSLSGSIACAVMAAFGATSPSARVGANGRFPHVERTFVVAFAVFRSSPQSSPPRSPCRSTRAATFVLLSAVTLPSHNSYVTLEAKGLA